MIQVLESVINSDTPYAFGEVWRMVSKAGRAALASTYEGYVYDDEMGTCHRVAYAASSPASAASDVKAYLRNRGYGVA